MRASTLVVVLFVAVALAAVPVLGADTLSNTIGSVGSFVHSFASSQARFQGLLAIALFVVFLVLFHLVVRAMPHMQEASGRLLNAAIMILSATLSIFATANIPQAAIAALQAQYQVAAFILLSLIPIAIIGGAVYLAMQFKGALGRIIAGILLILLGSNLATVYDFAMNQIHLGVLATILGIVRVGLILFGIYWIFSAFGDLGGGGRRESARSGSRRGNVLDRVLRREEGRARTVSRNDRRGEATEEKEYEDAVNVRNIDSVSLRSFEQIQKLVEAILSYARDPRVWQDNLSRIETLAAQFEPNKIHELLESRIETLEHAVDALLKDDSVLRRILAVDKTIEGKMVSDLKDRLMDKAAVSDADEAERRAREMYAKHRKMLSHHVRKIGDILSKEAHLVHGNQLAAARKALAQTTAFAQKLETVVKWHNAFRNPKGITIADHRLFLKDLKALFEQGEKARSELGSAIEGLEELERLEAALLPVLSQEHVREMQLLHDDRTTDEDFRATFAKHEAIRLR